MEGGVSADLRQLAAELKLVDSRFAAAVRRRIRAAVIEGGEEILERARANASWSTGKKHGTPIGDATTLRTAVTVRTAGVTMRTNQGKAPHARPLEMGSTRGGNTLRHPVFGNREDWTQQPTRPFFFKAVEEAGPAVEARISAAIDAAVRDAGFR